MINKGRGLLIVILGLLGVGKGIICKKFLDRYLDVVLLVLVIIWFLRNGEVDGINYYFMFKEEFKEKIEVNDFLEYVEVYDNYYGILKFNVEEVLESGKDVILEIDI